MHKTHLTERVSHPMYKGEGGDDAELGGAVGYIIGTFQGLMYQTSAGGGSACFGSLAGSLATVDAFGSILTKAYLPWYWAPIMLNL